MPKKFSATSLGYPSSTTVGTSGAIDARLVLVTASSRSLPDFWNCTFCGSVSMANRIVPPSRSLCIGEEPLYPTWVSLMPASFAKSSPTMCPIEPTPPLP